VEVLSLRTPLYVRGSFAKPDVGLEPAHWQPAPVLQWLLPFLHQRHWLWYR
jgi:hypothetical protein